MSIAPTLTPDELLAATELAPSIDELERIGQECFAPWIEAAKNGDLQVSYVRRLPGLKGYSAVFEKLRAPGLQVGVNSRDGQNHVVQNAFWEPVNALWVEAKGRDPATAKHDVASGKVDVEQYMATTARLLQSSNAADLIAGIAAATGRRSIEIAFIGNFLPVKSVPDFLTVERAYLYLFENPAKKRNYDQPKTEKPKFVTTSLFMASDVLKAWKTLHATDDIKQWVSEQTKKLRAAKWSEASQKASRAAFNNDWASILNAAVRDNYSGLLPGKIGSKGQKPQVSISCLRAAFAQLSFLRDCPKDDLGQPLGVSEILFKARILGHYIDESPSDADIRRTLSTLNYYDYRADTMPTYPAELNEKQVRPSCYESDRDWLNSLVEGKSQADTFRYLRSQHEALQSEVLELRETVRKLKQVKSTPSPAPQSDIEKQLAALTQQVAALAGNSQQPAARGKAKVVSQPTAPTARLDNPPRMSDAQMNAHRWLDIVSGEVKDHNYKADGDIWQMWAFSKRMLKDLSGVSQKIVGEFWALNEAELLALNEEWGLDNQHNKRRGMKQQDTSQDFDLQRPLELF